MTGVCSACGKEQRVPSHRGSRLSDYRCRACGGELHGKTRGAAGTSRTRVSCLICGKARMTPSNAVAIMEQPFELDGYTRSLAESRGENVGPFPAGPVCWHHDVQIIEAARA